MMTTPAGAKRFYRNKLGPSGMHFFTLAVKETDIWVALKKVDYAPGLAEGLESYVWRHRIYLEKYLEKDPKFRTAMTPHIVQPEAPKLAQYMARAAKLAGVGPMAAVAGAFAQLAGEWLLNYTTQVIVENGGDIFCCLKEPVKVGVYAGNSPFSGRMVVEVDAPGQKRGICTSSGTVGPSYSKGRADAAIIVADNALLADAVATAAANIVQAPEDLEKATAFAMDIESVRGALVIFNDKLAACGDIQLRQNTNL